MNIVDIHVYFFLISLLFLNVVDTQAVSGESSHLFGSLSQLELLWYNDKHVVKIMETLLEDSFIDYRPLKRYACYLTIFVTSNKNYCNNTTVANSLFMLTGMWHNITNMDSVKLLTIII